DLRVLVLVEFRQTILGIGEGGRGGFRPRREITVRCESGALWRSEAQCGARCALGLMRCDDLRQGGAHRLRSCGIACGEIDSLARISRKMVELGLRCIDVFELPYADASQRRPSERVISVRRFSDDRPRRAVEEAALRMWQASEYGVRQGQSARYRAARP